MQGRACGVTVRPVCRGRWVTPRNWWRRDQLASPYNSHHLTTPKNSAETLLGTELFRDRLPVYQTDVLYRTKAADIGLHPARHSLAHPQCSHPDCQQDPGGCCRLRCHPGLSPTMAGALRGLLVLGAACTGAVLARQGSAGTPPPSTHTILLKLLCALLWLLLPWPLLPWPLVPGPCFPGPCPWSPVPAFMVPAS